MAGRTIADKTVLVTGANRGLGYALVTEALRRGAGTVYAGMRHPVPHADPRVAAVPLDVTDPADVAAAAARIDALDVLVNNAGLCLPDRLDGRETLEDHLAVNLFGLLAVSTAFIPHLSRAAGSIVNVLSLGAIAPVPVMPSYAVSKAAAASLTQSQRALLLAAGVSVHGVYAGPIDTDMVRDLDLPKASPAEVAAAILDGYEAGAEDIFPDALSAGAASGWDAGPVKTLERTNLAMFAAGV
ncbi:SDR family NAD(P)-dependent oxidoreductase [Cryptosporangium phraense]|uniref:SDR family NAD(P)-dependent oxidoreductase n=1 Tax=Cryptosporangium phraense TaxID=2593070 RepID=A0A545AS20_9ACTN|nr:SDR family NAD(P)-dependent oxidoreductase [Cryptosporangium phraense]TQS43475.1 SDR family NAD(P)-dependent oxidoreductase [Cryptosporangium phraense]